MTRFHGSALVPGFARGILAYDAGHPTKDNIVIVPRPTLDSVLALSRLAPRALVIPDGMLFSHLGIHLASLGIPTFAIAGEIIGNMPTGVEALLDAQRGEILIEPGSEELAAYGQTYPQEAVKGRVSTLDGRGIVAGASVASVDGARLAASSGADEIGLLRSEFLFADAGQAITDEHYGEALSAVCQAFPEAPVRVRLFDLGGEKLFSWMPQVRDTDKALGLRGARIYTDPLSASLLDVQISVLTELSRSRDISVLVPFVTSVDEFVWFRRRIASQAGHSTLSIGCMIEIPSACATAREFAEVADFLALGTNDLMQCFFGADRSLVSASRHIDPYSPGLWRFLHSALGQLPRTTQFQVCGRLPFFPMLGPLLIGLGFSSFSLEAASIPAFKRTVSQVSSEDLALLAMRAIDAAGPNELRELLLPPGAIGEGHIG